MSDQPPTPPAGQWPPPADGPGGPSGPGRPGSAGWGQPPASSPPPRPQRNLTGLLLAAAAGVIVLLLVVIAALVSSRPADQKAASQATPTNEATTTTADTIADEPATTEPAPEPSGPPKVPAGETLEMTNGFGDTVAEITVGGPTHPSRHKGIRFSTGDEFDRPKHGLYLGVWVKVTAKQDGVDTFSDFHVAQGGHHYSGDACCPSGFEPALDYTTLSKGETTEGWVIFDVQSRHGEIVITDYDGKRLGAWTF